jgi:chromosomal replication initiator protein
LVDNFLDQIDICKNSLDLNLVLRFEIADANPGEDGEFAKEYRSESSRPVSAAAIPSEIQPPQAAVSRALSHHSSIDPEYSFSTFIKGPSNKFAHAACQAVADFPGKTYNPLFIYGSSGLGKTHLLHAVANRVLAMRPDAQVTYITSERFMNEMIYCLRFEKMHEFRRKYRNCDVLLVDDIQFIAGKVHTQEEFFHTFNALYEAKGQIVVTSDQFPKDIPDIEDRLRNRFQWGLIADIQPPDVEHRVAILMSKAEKFSIPLSHEVAFFIANHAKNNVRVLEGSLKRIAAFASLQGRPLNLELAAEILKNMLGEPTKSVTVDKIMKAVADHFKVKVTDLKSKKRQRAFSLPRQIAMYLSRTRVESSFPEIGAKFGGKDHTTVMFACRKIQDRRSKDLDLKNTLDALERRLDQLN